jgi:hypothetical protein
LSTSFSVTIITIRKSSEDTHEKRLRSTRIFSQSARETQKFDKFLTQKRSFVASNELCNPQLHFLPSFLYHSASFFVNEDELPYLNVNVSFQEHAVHKSAPMKKTVLRKENCQVHLTREESAIDCRIVR